MFFLDCIISEMSIDVGRIVIKLFAASSQIALSIPIGLKITANRGD
jgi:hypothetical protein